MWVGLVIPGEEEIAIVDIGSAVGVCGDGVAAPFPGHSCSRSGSVESGGEGVGDGDAGASNFAD